MTHTQFEQQSEGMPLSDRLYLFDKMFPKTPQIKPIRIVRVVRRAPEVKPIKANPTSVSAAKNKVRVRLIGTTQEFESISEASRGLKIATCSIRNNLRGKSKTTRLGKWEIVK